MDLWLVSASPDSNPHCLTAKQSLLCHLEIRDSLIRRGMQNIRGFLGGRSSCYIDIMDYLMAGEDLPQTK